MRRRIAPVIMLALLSPFTAEFLLGDQYLAGQQPVGRQLGTFILFVAFYGMAALLIRELARRLRIGWTGLMLLALGFGILEEGMITQSLFNPHYLGLDLIEPGYIPGAGIGAPWTVFVISLHVIWSISAPIAITEAWFGRGDAAGRGTEPWLRRAGIITCLVIFLIAAAATAAFSVLTDQHRFVASPWQLAAAALAVALAVLAAVRLRARQPATGPAATMRPTLLSALLAVLATSAFEIMERLTRLSPWLSAVGLLAIWCAGILIMVRWHRGGTGPVPFGLAAGAVLSYCWVGLLPAVRAGSSGILEQSVLVIIALAVIGWTGARSTDRAGLRPRPERSPVPH